MTTLSVHSAPIQTTRRPFGQGILPAPKRGPSPEDHAYFFGLTLGLEMECPTPAPPYYTEAERFAFEMGQDDASKELDRRAEERMAGWREECEWTMGRYVDA